MSCIMQTYYEGICSFKKKTLFDFSFKKFTCQNHCKKCLQFKFYFLV